MSDDRHTVKIPDATWDEIQRILLARDTEVAAFLAWLVSHPEEVRRLKQAMQRDAP